MPAHNNRLRPAFLLRAAAGLFLVVGLAITAWLVDKAIRYPQIQARQLDAEAPLWLPMIFFVAVSTVAAGYLFTRAARRMEAGEDPPSERPGSASDG